MSTVVTVGGLTATSTTESAADMTTALSPSEPEAPEPRVVQDKGQPVDPEKAEISKAASKLGEKGGEARAKALKAKPIPEKKADEAGRPEPSPSEDVEGDGEPSAEHPSEVEETAEQKDAKKGNPRHDPQARVAQATREAAELRREAAELKARLDRLERERTAPVEARDGQEQKQPAAREDVEPEEGDFESYSDWVRAHAAWNRREWKREAAREQQARTVASKYAARIDGAVTGLKTAVDKATAADPEFMSKVSPEVMAFKPTFMLDRSTERPSAKNGIADYLLSAPESAPALMLHLTEHPDVLQRIAALPNSHAVTREMAILEAKLSDAATASTSAERQVSKAKPPVRLVTGSPHTADSVPGEDAPYEQHKAYWSRKDRERQAQR